MAKMNPCDTCPRFENPDECTKKDCLRWQLYFMDKWKEINNYYEAHKGELDNGQSCEKCDAC